MDSRRPLQTVDSLIGHISYDVDIENALLAEGWHDHKSEWNADGKLVSYFVKYQDRRFIMVTWISNHEGQVEAL